MEPGQRADEKIFGLGLGKTGTTSLAKAMYSLGYIVKHNPKHLFAIEKHDFLNDMFIATRYRLLDYVYPNAKFICTYRNVDDWIESCRKYDKKRPITDLVQMETRFYGMGHVCFDEQKMRKRFPEYYKEVREYFKDRDDYLEVNICEGDGWEKICPFLGKEVPDVPFPWKNRQR